MKTFLTCAGVAVLGFGALWGLAYHGLVFESFFSPKFSDVRRKAFEKTKSFNDGAIQELQNMQFEYIKATPEQKPGLASIIRHRSATVPSENLPSDLSQFISTLPE